MIEVEMTSLDIERETGVKHNKIMRDLRDKWFIDYPLNSEGISLSNFGQSDFIIKSSSYVNSRGKEYLMYVLNKNAANAFMANYSKVHAMKIVAYINSLEQELLKKEKEISLMKEIVWEVINGQAYVSQEQALKCAGVKHPRLFMKYLKGHKTFYNDVVYERSYLVSKQCNKNGDRWWKFTKDGFKWLLDNNTKINDWVEEQKVVWNKLPC